MRKIRPPEDAGPAERPRDVLMEIIWNDRRVDSDVHRITLAQAAERRWRKLNGCILLGDTIKGVQFKDGAKVAA